MKRLHILRRALLGKWSWCFKEERRFLWHMVICSKYGEESGRWTTKVDSSYGKGVCKAIKLDWDIVDCKELFDVGKGRRVHF